VRNRRTYTELHREPQRNTEKKANHPVPEIGLLDKIKICFPGHPSLKKGGEISTF
jgi:hypothetical protein